ncbi:uncharacterized protein BO66DRAFT_460497 [Aspergillus aculeatinus CBS 121060]|uniref:Uncharacterized protein n=1 Tax=Aspergillus aculeatinus CBS 121060 TaxID=1448322 RepID=A0ACD1GXS9_9EURO|nr:hypothetical protein BO66DRAFT_460497 [Aspergillus aculeatinus CBS 121060]RAH66149.1 hypothetical protein BO66DRAFT_460497 [Aspergillus aculeatinus CBS 121060]
MDGLRSLPHELLAMIIGYAADWVSLESLILTSPLLAALFEPGEFPDALADSDAIYLFKEILQANPVMNSGLDRYVFMCAALRRPSVTDSSLADFLARDFSLETTRTTMTRASLREMVAVAANIQRLACICLTSFLTRLRDLFSKYLAKARILGGLPDVGPYRLQDVGPPSWIEEFRVYRALWHLQLLADLLSTGTATPPTPPHPQQSSSWSQSDIMYLQNRHLRWSGGGQLPSGQDDAWFEIIEVSGCLEALYGPDDAPVTAMAQSADASSPPQIEPQSSIRYYTSLYNPPLISKMPVASRDTAVWAPPEPPMHLSDDVRWWWGQDLRATQVNDALEDMREVEWDYVGHWERERPALDGLGMSVWDLWRLFGLGLYDRLHMERKTFTTPDGVEHPRDFLETRFWLVEYRYRRLLRMHGVPEWQLGRVFSSNIG